MRRLTRIVAFALVIALAPCLGLAAQANFEDLVKKAETDYTSVKGTVFQEELTAELRSQMHLVFGNCASKLAQSSPAKADAVLELDSDGKVATVTTQDLTPGAQCVERELKKIAFPQPPKAPFLFFFTITR